jgi:hypothetical protein
VLAATLLLASPFLLVWPLRAQFFAHTRWPDPFFHTAVIQHGRDLLERFGTNNRQFARAAFTVPGRLVNAAFGDIGGYYAFRYVLVLVAVVPAFVLLRRLHGVAAGAVAVAAILANPVIVRAWGTDYPDSSAVSYLVAGYCCIAMPAQRRARLGWAAAAGAFLCLAVHSNFVSLPLVLCALLVVATSRSRSSIREVVREGAALLAAVIGVSLVLSVAAWLLYGTADIWTPTFHAFNRLRTPEQVAVNHTSDWRWALDAPHLLVPLLLAVVWLLLRVRSHHGFRPAETLLWLTLVAQSAVFVILQFALEEQVLEFHFYLSMLWPAAVLVAASTVCELSRVVLGRGGWRWIPAAAILLLPIAIEPLHSQISMRLAAGMLLASAVVLAVFVLVAGAGPVGRLAAMAVFLVGTYALVVGQSPTSPLRRGQVAFPKPLYGEVFGKDDDRAQDLYAVASDLHKVVPEPPRPGVWMLMWTAEDLPESANIATMQYGWIAHVVRGLPVLDAADVARIRDVRPDVLVLLSDSLAPFPVAVENVRNALPGSDTPAPIKLHHGTIELYVGVIDVVT